MATHPYMIIEDLKTHRILQHRVLPCVSCGQVQWPIVPIFLAKQPVPSNDSIISVCIPFDFLVAKICGFANNNKN